MSVAAGAGVAGGVHSRLRAGVVVTVRVPASSANLGPGFDSLGLALRIHDVVSLTVVASGLAVDVEGEGADGVPRDEDHLVVRAARAAFERAGAAQPGLRLRCRNGIPHGRGLGSSAAAVVAGILAARGCLLEPGRLTDEDVLSLATSFEGHPDNAAAALHGGATVAWCERDGSARAAPLEVHPELNPVLCVPGNHLPTSHARTLLPAEVPHADAAFNSGRAALLVEALARRPDLLLQATEDRLHQAQRGPAMPDTQALVARVRANGGAAVVSGAGPTVLVLGTANAPGEAVARSIAELGAEKIWQITRPGIDTLGAVITTDGD